MIADANTVDCKTTLDTDICIVGAGAAGITLALALSEGSHRVILLESGGVRQDTATQALYEGSVTDPALHPPLSTYRRRIFGGSTTLWGGRCVPFDPIDFEARPWVAHSGWPLGPEALAPFYPAANMLCDAGDFTFTAETAFPAGMRTMVRGFISPNFTDETLERFSCPINFGQRYRARLVAAKHLRVLLHANVVELHTVDGGRRVTSVDVRTLDGRNFTVRANVVVLASGGLEIPRLLLASRGNNPNGIGNAHDQVGRYYMCHIAGTTGDIRLARGADDVWHGYELSDDGVYCRRRFALLPQAQRRLQTGNLVARLHHPRITNPAHRTGALSALYLAKPFIGYEYGKRLHGAAGIGLRGWLAHLRNVAMDPVGTSAFLLHWLGARTLATRRFPSIIVRSRTNRYSLDFHAEQEPNPQSRVTLGRDSDALEMEKLVVDWRYTDNDLRTVQIAIATLASDLEASGCGRLTASEDEIADSALRDGAYGGHHIGTARMSTSPRSGVVDSDCRVHGMDNLYLAGSAVFPTSSQANPTLTIVAMALRLAARLDGRQFRV